MFWKHYYAHEYAIKDITFYSIKSLNITFIIFASHLSWIINVSSYKFFRNIFNFYIFLVINEYKFFLIFNEIMNYAYTFKLNINK